MVFEPKRSFGWLWLLAMGLFLTVMPVVTLSIGGPAPAQVWAIEILIACLGLWFLALAALFPAMRYEVGEGELRMRYGPMTWRVALADIYRVTRTDLVWTIWSSMRFPGFALFKVPYGAGVGTVRMCATRSVRDVLLLETQDGRFGVTPADERRFVDALGVVDRKGF